MFSKESFLLFWPALLAFDLVRRKRLNVPFHALNAAATVLFFFVKNAALGIRNPRFIQYPVGESLKAAVGTLGYYVKAMVVPLTDRFFLATADAKRPIYLAFGFAALALGLVLIYASLKDKKLWPPLILAASFLAGHVVLIFGSAFPYTVYSRYMTIPALGLVWLAALLLVRLPEKVRYFPVFAAILLFMPSIALNAGAYRSELSFWQKALKASPRDGYVVFQLSKAHYRNKDNIGAEVNLNKALSMPLRKETAILISQLYADISYAKADYAGARKWIESVEEFEAVPGQELAASIKLQNAQRKAKLSISEGRTDEAERMLEESITMFPAMKPAYADLYSMYLGYEMWDKARALEDRIRSRFPSMAQDCRQVAVQLESMTLEQKIAFYVAHRNFGKARALAETMTPPDLAHRLLIAELSYWLGRSDEGEKAIEDIAAENPARSDVMNSIAAFYLNDLFRPKEALTYLNGSLELDPDQPKIRYLAYELRDRYLGKLTEPWK